MGRPLSAVRLPGYWPATSPGAAMPITFRLRWLNRSAMSRFPPASIATPWASYSRPARERVLAAPGGGRDDPAGTHLAHPRVAPVGDVQVAGGIDGQAQGEIQPRRRGRAAIPRELGLAGSRHRGHDPARIQLPHPLVPHIRNVEVAGGVRHHPLRPVELRRNGWTAVATEAPRDAEEAQAADDI